MKTLNLSTGYRIPPERGREICLQVSEREKLDENMKEGCLLPDTLEQDDPTPCKALARNNTP